MQKVVATQTFPSYLPHHLVSVSVRMKDQIVLLCLLIKLNNTCYPWESVSAVAVGQGFGTVDGTVYAWFTNKDSSRLEELQKSQQVDHSNWAKLK